MVKDLRTNYELTGGGAERVLDGELGGFVANGTISFIPLTVFVQFHGSQPSQVQGSKEQLG